LLIVMMLATVLLISLSAALPNIYTAGMREREEELIFRGNEYARAIVLFRRQFRRYPTSVKELLQTSGIRFLRREYADPMSRRGKWRFIHADANGTILDSVTLPRSPAASAGKTEGPALGAGAGDSAPAGKSESPAPDAEKERSETSAEVDPRVEGSRAVQRVGIHRGGGQPGRNGPRTSQPAFCPWPTRFARFWNVWLLAK
jgi:type II secretory pathway pseudopilin PulG